MNAEALVRAGLGEIADDLIDAQANLKRYERVLSGKLRELAGVSAPDNPYHPPLDRNLNTLRALGLVT